ncbi:hypothetical protein JKA74_08975 [Marivirga sp. S37H4]|uniref:Uncharacterized protein n=1 Tax=Marivirga aurantiaca TaxID=2802615 RepID=A0A934WXW1_9BACT|nr:hypothetical protein [Marivirga aurantiaca]MBK6265169.1 hypothetical protein [Marivirga aurantiaca]
MDFNLKLTNFFWLFLVAPLLLCFNYSVEAQKVKKKILTDSVRLQSGFVLILEDTFYLPEKDTIILLSEEKSYQIKAIPYFRSDKFYDSLESKAGNTEVTRMLFDLLFKSSSQDISDKKLISNGEEVFKPFEGKIIGEISVKGIPILEGSVQDTTKKATSWYAKTINNIHVPTRKSIIKQNTLFKSGEKVDPFQLADNERILRRLRTIRDAKIYLIPRLDTPDIVDVEIVTQDVVSIGAALNYSSMNDFNFDIYDRNILGYARDFQLSYYFDEHENPKHGYGFQYRVPNFWGSFIRGTFIYENTYFREQIGMSLMRDFFTPEIKYGGGASLQHVSEFYRPLSIPLLEIPYTKNEGSLWIGRSFQLRKRTNLILQTRASSTTYVERPFVTEDSNRFFMNSDIYYASAALITRTYSKSWLIKGFGRTEDIPKGKLLSFTYGYDNNEFYNRHYWQLKAGYAEYFQDIGYASFTTALGAFKNGDKWEDGIFNTSLNYFSPLIMTGKSFFRQFINVNYLNGIHRRSDNALVIDNKFQTDGERRPLGEKRFTMSFESVYFTSWYFYGCRFSLYNRNNFHWLSYDELFDHKKFFSSFGIGVRILNESFVFPTIELNFTYYKSPGTYPDTTQLRLFNNYPTNFNELQIGRPDVLRFDDFIY